MTIGIQSQSFLGMTNTYLVSGIPWYYASPSYPFLIYTPPPLENTRQPPPLLYTPSYTLTCHTTPSTGQPYYAIETDEDRAELHKSEITSDSVSEFPPTPPHVLTAPLTFDESPERTVVSMPFATEEVGSGNDVIIERELGVEDEGFGLFKEAEESIKKVESDGREENWSPVEGYEPGNLDWDWDNEMEEDGVATEKGEMNDVENNDNDDDMCLFGYALKMFDESSETQSDEPASHMFDGSPGRVLELGTHGMCEIDDVSDSFLHIGNHPLKICKTEDDDLRHSRDTTFTLLAYLLDSTLQGLMPVSDLILKLEKECRDVSKSIRYGRLEEACNPCRSAGQPWRAATLCAFRGLDHFPSVEALMKNGKNRSLQAVELESGVGHQRHLWKWASYVASERIVEEEASKYEAAIYASQCSNLKRILSICTDWESACWAIAKSWFHVQVDMDLVRFQTGAINQFQRDEDAIEKSPGEWVGVSQPIAGSDNWLPQVFNQQPRNLYALLQNLHSSDAVHKAVHHGCKEQHKRIEMRLMLGDLPQVLDLKETD